MVIADGAICHRLVAILKTAAFVDTPPAERLEGEVGAV
jgi:hypothetical protein